MTNVSTLPAVSMHDAPVPTILSAASLMLDVNRMEHLARMGELMASSRTTIPGHLQGKPADCAAIIMQAVVWNMNPWAVAQKTHLTQGGALGYEAQLINAVITTNAPITGRPEYEFLGDWSKILGKVEERKSDKGGKYYVAAWKASDEEGLGVIVRCQLKGESSPREVTVMMSQAYPRFSTQWATDPQQQITYLAIRKWARRYTPDVILGVYSPDELDDVTTIDAGSGSTQAEPTQKSNAERLRERATERGAKKPDPKPDPKPAQRSDLMVAVLRAIDRASTMDDLTAALDLARELPDGAEKDEARATYAERQRVLKARNEAPPPTTTRAADEPPSNFDTE